LVLGLGAGHLALFAFTTLRRLRYPFSLEWMESGSYDSLARLLEGRPLYDRPTLEFIPFNYTPLYYYASALVARGLGTGFTPLRAVSLLAACGTVLLVYLLVRRAGAGQLAALAAAITFPATFAITGGYLDAARPDALYAFMLTAGVLALVHAGAARWSAFLAGMMFALAYLTKQSAIPALGLLFVHQLIRRRPVGLLLLLGFTLTAGATVAWQMQATQGWYGYYTFEIASGYPLAIANLPHFAANYLGPLAVAVLFAVAWITWPARPRTPVHETLLVGLVSILCGCFWLTLYPGTAENVAIPAMMACSVLLGLGLDSVLERARHSRSPDSARLAVLAYVAVAIQWVGLLYAPARYVPDARDVAAGRRLVERIAAEPGDVLIPNHGYLARLAGRSGQVHALALANAVQGDRHGYAKRVALAFDSTLAAGRYSLLVLDSGNFGARDSIPGYGPPEDFFTDRDVLQTRAGTRTRPDVLRPRLPR
jgi:hypothetical protein